MKKTPGSYIDKLSLTEKELQEEIDFCLTYGLYRLAGKSKYGNQRYYLPFGYCTTGKPTGRTKSGIKCVSCGQNTAKKNGKHKDNHRQKYICNNPDCRHGWVELPERYNQINE